MADPTAARLTEELRRFAVEQWAGEPTDVTQLRDFSLPPMGTMPCVLYCNFDLFWAGEQLQVCRGAALRGELPPAAASLACSLLLDRVATRLSKWEMAETVALVRAAADTLRTWRPETAAELAGVTEHLMIALDRIQAAVDAIIPWSDLDTALTLRGPLAAPG